MLNFSDSSNFTKQSLIEFFFKMLEHENNHPLPFGCSPLTQTYPHLLTHNRWSRIAMFPRNLKCYLKCNFPMTRYVFVFVVWSIVPNFLKGREVILPCFDLYVFSMTNGCEVFSQWASTQNKGAEKYNLCNSTYN